MACTGTEFCSLALVETKARMAAMLRWLRDNVDLPDDVDQLKMHFSGCTADCGHANTADIGLLGMRARKDGEMVEAVDIGLGGGVGEEPSFVDYVTQRVPGRRGAGRDQEPPRRVRRTPRGRPDVPRVGRRDRHRDARRAVYPRRNELRRPVSHRRQAVVVPVRRVGGGVSGRAAGGGVDR